MKRTFRDLSNYIKLFDGYKKPKLNFQELYKLFPQFTFTPADSFGTYKNFNQAFEAKIYDMMVTDGKNECLICYKEYGDADENSAYVMDK